LERLLQSGDLRIENEDWLVDLIHELGDDYRRLLNEVKSEYLIAESLSTFFDHVNYWEITDEIWTSLDGVCVGKTI
jgi:hypothetical protein